MRKNLRLLIVIPFIIAAFLVMDFVYVEFIRGLPEPERATAIMHKAAVRLAARYGCTEVDLERSSLNVQGDDYYILHYRFRSPGDNSFTVHMSRNGSVDISGSPELARYRFVKSDNEEKSGVVADAAFHEKPCGQ
jgi:hypothetical protein